MCASVVAHAGDAERDRMYELLETYFSGTTRDRFEADLDEKEAVILLRDELTGVIQGFSTFMRMYATIDGEQVLAFFSGDTIIDRRYWGDTLLSRVWSQTIFAEAERASMRTYWFLICSGYKTWRFLPVFFREFYPNATHLKRVVDRLGEEKFGDEYVDGIVRFRRPTPLRRGIADITDERLRDPHIALFARLNPGHVDGDELACLTEISRSNLTRAGERMLGRPV